MLNRAAFSSLALLESGLYLLPASNLNQVCGLLGILQYMSCYKSCLSSKDIYWITFNVSYCLRIQSRNSNFSSPYYLNEMPSLSSIILFLVESDTTHLVSFLPYHSALFHPEQDADGSFPRASGFGGYDFYSNSRHNGIEYKSRSGSQNLLPRC